MDRPGRLTLVVILTIQDGTLDSFRAFERQAAVIMAAHGGSIERAVFIPPATNEESMREVHVVTFPSEQAFAAYRADPALRALHAMRAACVAKTEVLTGHDAPDYRS
jgi:hypothetical protein